MHSKYFSTVMVIHNTVTELQNWRVGGVAGMEKRTYPVIFAPKTAAIKTTLGGI